MRINASLKCFIKNTGQEKQAKLVNFNLLLQKKTQTINMLLR